MIKVSPVKAKNQRNSPSGLAATSAVLSILLILCLAYLFIYVLCGYTVPLGFIAIRQIKFGPLQGYSESGLSPGLHWGLPGGFYTEIYPVPQTMQIIQFHSESGESGKALPPLEIQSADRATIDVDITLLIRFYSEAKDAHGGPANLVRKIGITESAWRNHIQRTAEDQLKRALGSISTQDFYKPSFREAALEQSQKSMQEILSPDGIEVVAVLLRRYGYREDRIDQAIFQKNLQDQEERLNKQASMLAEAQAALEQVSAEGDAQIKTLRTEGDNKAQVLRSEGDLYNTSRRAEGDLEVAKAKAEVDKLKASVLSESAGAEIYVARELSGMISSLKGGIVTEIDPYDLNQWMKRLDVGGEEKKGGQLK